MATLNIGGKKIKVDDGFLSLSPEEQNAAVEEIANSLEPAAQPAEPEPVAEQQQVEPDAEQPTLGHKVGAAIDGAAQGLTLGFSDEIAAGLDSGFGFLGDYEQSLADERARMEENRRLAGGYELGGQLVGALGGGVGLAKAGLSASARAANAGLGKRVAAGVTDASILGGLYGAGIGENATDRASGAVSGAITGGALGGAIPVVGAGLRAGGQAVADKIMPTIRGTVNPQLEAARRVGGAFERDAARLSPADEFSATINNQNLMNVDRGGETVRALGRSVANQSPEAREAISGVAFNRFGTQGGRAQGLIDRVMNGAVDDIDFQEAARAASRAANKPAYEKAFRRNYGTQFPEEFAPLLSRIPPAAVTNAKKVAKAEGRPFGEQLIAKIDDAAEAVEFSRMPSIREWHYIQRGLRSAADNSFRQGVGEVGTAYKGLHKELLNAMDSVNPDYRAARRGAFEFFQADDALEAGRKFVTQNKDVRQAQRALGKMKPAEREAFRVGFAGELRDQISKVRDRTDVVDKIFGSEQSRRKIRAALGREAFGEFEAFTRIEGAMNLTRNAIQGNSTTVRQLAEMGLAQGAQAGAGGALGYLAGDWKGAIAGAALTRGVRAIGVRADQKAIEYVGKILASNNPQSLARASKVIAKSTKKKEALDGIQRLIERSISLPIIQQTIGQPAP